MPYNSLIHKETPMKVNGYEIKPSANLQGANLRSAYLEGVNLRDANLRSAYLWGVNLQGANLNGADLEFADVTGTILEKKEESQDNTSLSQKVKELEEELKKYKENKEEYELYLKLKEKFEKDTF